MVVIILFRVVIILDGVDKSSAPVSANANLFLDKSCINIKELCDSQTFLHLTMQKMMKYTRKLVKMCKLE